MKKPAKCTLAARHTWQWAKDVTIRFATYRASGTTVRLSRRGVFNCACGATRHGMARSGL